MVESQKKFEYKGIQYWVTVISGILEENKTTYFLAYISLGASKPEHLGQPVNDPQGRRQLATTPIGAMANAQAVMQSIIDAEN